MSVTSGLMKNLPINLKPYQHLLIPILPQDLCGIFPGRELEHGHLCSYMCMHLCASL